MNFYYEFICFVCYRLTAYISNEINVQICVYSNRFVVTIDYFITTRIALR